MLKSTFSWLQRCRWQYGSIFIRLAVAFQICESREILRKLELIEAQGHPRSSIPVPMESAQATDPPLVINSNFGLSPTLFEILSFKARKWLVFPTPPLFDAP